MRPTFIDLFSGAGGMSLGFEQAGFDPVAAVEIDPIHATVHEFNFPHCATIPRSVTEVSGEELLSLPALNGSSPDVVIGGAPCQGFSLIGQRALDDPRNSLVKDFVRIVRDTQARYFVFENVKGLTVGKHKRFLDEIVEEFRLIGYELQLPWKVLNARDYGVPQDRQRLILIGARVGETLPDYPEVQSVGPSCGDALSDLPDAEEFDELLHNDSVRASYRDTLTSDYAREMRCISNDAWHFGYVRDWDSTSITSSLRTKHTDISRRRFRETEEGAVEPISRFFKLPRSGVSNTLRAGTDSARGAFTSPRPIHYEFDRCVTVREMARLHGFPDWFRFHVTKWHGARQIGNAVPPPLARAVASQLIGAMGVVPNRPKKTICQGEQSLIELNMAQAASYFGIDVPIGKRDRKSGAKKRNQSEIEEGRMIAERRIA
ncbi:MAG: DNA cytosine methyltransferase [Pseudomonadota bacterium]